MKEKILEILKEGADLRLDSGILGDIEKSINILKEALKNGNKVLICGNGGSASQAEHFAGELIVKMEVSGKSLPGIALTNPTILTAIANDYGFEHVFSRQIEGYGKEGDVLIALTTSDYNEEDKHSLNLKLALEKAKEKGLKTIGLFSIKSGKIQDLVDIAIKVNSRDTARIQEMHITILHIITLFLENELR